MVEKKNILVVDDEEDITLSIINYLKKHISDLNTLAAFDGDKALSIIKSSKIDILVTDIRMPGVNGIDLLLELKKINPEAKAIVITAFGSELLKKRSEEAGAIHYIEKPFKLSHLCTLIKKIINEEEEGFKGSVSQLQLIDVLQMICINRKSMIVEVVNNLKKGKIYVINGDIVHCECEGKEGKNACFEILSWKNGEFNLLPLNQLGSIKRTINENWMSLFMQGMKEIDEVKANNGDNQSTVRAKIREIITSLFHKIDNIETNIIFNIEKNKVFFDGDYEDSEFLEKRVSDYSYILNKLGEIVETNEKEELSEVVLILNNCFLIFMKITRNLVWCVKIRDTQKLGVAKITLEKSKNLLIEELKKAGN